MPNFSPGDLVWAYSAGDQDYVKVPKGEVAATIVSYNGYAECTDDTWEHFYVIDVPEYPGRVNGVWSCDESSLRPRRDDYQQHEGLGSRDQLTKPVAPDLTEASVKELFETLPRHVVKAARFALMYSAGPDAIRRMLKRG